MSAHEHAADPWALHDAADAAVGECTCDGCLDAEGAPGWASRRHGLRAHVVDSALSDGVIHEDLTTEERRAIVDRARAWGWSNRKITERTGIAEPWRLAAENRVAFAEKQRAYYEANKDEIAEKQRARYQTRQCIDCGIPTGGKRCRPCHGRHLGHSRRNRGNNGGEA